MNLFHLSENNLDGTTLHPRIPDNYFTKNGYEDKETKRVCFSESIDGALMALSCRLKDKEFYVHTPMQGVVIRKPSVKDVPDSKITKEVWVLDDVKIKCIGKIHVTGDANEKGISFKYGNNVAELYKWNWKWINKQHLTESVDLLLEEMMTWINQ